MEYRILFSYFLTVPFLVGIDIGYQWFFNLLSPDTRWSALAGFYIVYSLGLYYFAIYQGFSRQSLHLAVLSGAVFGFFMYATYNFSIMSVLGELNIPVLFVDVARGVLMSGIVAGIGYYINRLMLSA
ncbi:MAG TPA: DUF2177 family protein [Candidatus Paceibacterota bacterium]